MRLHEWATHAWLSSLANYSSSHLHNICLAKGFFFPIDHFTSFSWTLFHLFYSENKISFQEMKGLSLSLGWELRTRTQICPLQGDWEERKSNLIGCQYFPRTVMLCTCAQVVVLLFSASLWRRDLLDLQRKKPGLTEVPCSRSHTQWTPEWKCGNLWRLFHLNAPVP